MNYKLQLEQPQWGKKREEILKRDSFKCSECPNISYQNNFNSGLIFSNKIEHGTALSTLHKEQFIVRIWDMKLGKIQTSFIDKNEFNADESYVAFYEINKDFVNTLGLKKILNINLEPNLSMINYLKGGIKSKVTDTTFNLVYERITNLNEWKFIRGLHIHHKYYQEGKLAWEYDINALTTLCWTCHEKLHKNMIIPILDLQGIEIGKYTNCERCAGAGYFPEYDHINSGVCFRCDGNRFEELI